MRSGPASDRPAHGSETVEKKSRLVFHDVMRGLEPGDGPRTLRLRHFTKTHEGAHLMHVAPDGLLKISRERHLRIDRNLEQLRFAVRQPPKDPIEQRPAS